MNGTTLWLAEIWGKDPLRKKTIWPIEALSEDQAMILAEKKANEVFGEKGKDWLKLYVHMPNIK